MADVSYQSNHRKTALALSLVPGLGQLYNKQFLKGGAFLVLTAAFFIVFLDTLNMGLWGLVTLGEKHHEIILSSY